ncbi:MAG TPA: class I SAM-dependent methyltransferase [Solirubrobacterales bacterium]|jgi:SAM-dependent methyltransferase|nr:class I SAM-dependent methyltransferase [Solirubrobacterales bacterium]HMX70251.1 class I SAM-dependent methyltransferase [Solirubrobacterales bacterium]HNC04698.1 class I SAM-dependent methyltransferase [Solirubrobacterales bacterium]HNE77619.1 class I SAM-dependent methyltransferase [Solirubrobacterales bacterium]HNI39614.1 class I SAM-dependent methyltransferase [Solirubrobacterales bacterium]
MAANSTETVDTTNYEKFQTGNPVVKRLIGGFYDTVEEVVKPLKPATVLDAGCGEGETLDRLSEVLPPAPTGIDLNPESVEFAARRLPGATIRQADLLNLPFEDGSFDLVLCLEVLEHLPDPAAGLAELARVSGRDIVVSVPHEPWFRLGSFARGKYLKTWGNHPEHVNHWNPKSLKAFLSTRTEVVEVQTSMPWIIARCRPLPAG